MQKETALSSLFFLGPIYPLNFCTSAVMVSLSNHRANRESHPWYSRFDERSVTVQCPIHCHSEARGICCKNA